jgi:hypothetical protein
MSSRFLLFCALLGQIDANCSPFGASNKGCYRQDDFPGGGQTITVECASGYVLTSSGECVTPCPTGQYLFGSSCVSCAANCDSCFGTNDFQCSQCAQTHTLNFQRVCSKKCSRADQFGTPVSSQCIDCDSSCGSCFAAGETACTACPVTLTGATYSLRVLQYAVNRTSAGYCLKDPTFSYAGYYRQYPSDRMIIQCPFGCSRCSDRYTCTACQTGYYLYPPSSSGAQYALCYPL